MKRRSDNHTHSRIKAERGSTKLQLECLEPRVNPGGFGGVGSIGAGAGQWSAQLKVMFQNATPAQVQTAVAAIHGTVAASGPRGGSLINVPAGVNPNAALAFLGSEPFVTYAALTRLNPHPNASAPALQIGGGGTSSLVGGALAAGTSVSALTSAPPVLATNIGGAAPMASEGAFVNVAMTLNPWGTYQYPWKTDPSLTFSADGYPLENASTMTYLYGYPNGQYQFSYTGSATLTVTGAGSLNAPPVTANGVTTGSFTVLITPTHPLLGFNVTNIDPNNPMDNFKVVDPQYTLNSTQVYTSAFLTRLAPFSLLRFSIGWNNTANNVGLVNWSDRVLPTDFLQEGPNGLAYEYIIGLANLTHKDIWISIPYMASTEYVTQMAQFFAANLDPGINLYLEYSNEVWNGGTGPLNYVKTAALANPSLIPTTDQTALVLQEAAYQIVTDGEIFRNAFGASASVVKPVLAGFISDPTAFTTALQYVQQTFGPPSQYLSDISIAPYIFMSNSLDNSSLTMDILFASLNQNLSIQMAAAAQSVQIGNSFGLPTVAYEGGQSLSPWNTYGVVTNSWLKYTAQRDPRMYTLYQNLIKDWQLIGGGFLSFTAQYFYSRNSGFWGLLDQGYMSGPEVSQKWDAVLAMSMPMGDADLDGVVNYHDFLVFKTYYNYHWKNTGWEEGDFDNDGTIGLDDFNLLEAHLTGLTPAQQAAVTSFAISIGGH